VCAVARAAPPCRCLRGRVGPHPSVQHPHSHVPPACPGPPCATAGKRVTGQGMAFLACLTTCVREVLWPAPDSHGPTLGLLRAAAQGVVGAPGQEGTPRRGASGGAERGEGGSGSAVRGDEGGSVPGATGGASKKRGRGAGGEGAKGPGPAATGPCVRMWGGRLCPEVLRSLGEPPLPQAAGARGAAQGAGGRGRDRAAGECPPRMGATQGAPAPGGAPGPSGPPGSGPGSVHAVPLHGGLVEDGLGCDGGPERGRKRVRFEDDVGDAGGGSGGGSGGGAGSVAGGGAGGGSGRGARGGRGSR
jgi:hypothetical protein